MKLTFHIPYRTVPGERLVITSNVTQLGNGDPGKALPMKPAADGCFHSATIETSPATAIISYRYRVVRDDGSSRDEWGRDHTLRLDSHLPSVEIHDHWQDIPDDKAFYSSVFTECICKPEAPDTPHSLKPGRLMLSVEAPMVMPGMRVAVCGSASGLGTWDPANALPLSHADFPRWTIQLPLEDLGTGIVEYKFILIRESDHTVVGWEPGENRRMFIDEEPDAASVIEAGMRLRPILDHWRGVGTAIPVFSLRSDADFGVGDFFDLKEMIDWAAETGQRIIQLLPVNDTTMTHSWTDSYPYNAISCFALHPMYLRLQEMGQLNDRHRQSQFDALARELNTLEEVDYERVNRAKTEFTRLIFAQQGHAEMTGQAYRRFYEANSSWLRPYAAFCTLRDLYGTADSSAWEQYAVYAPSLIDRFIELHRNETDYYCYIQYHLDRQLREVRDYAHSRGVTLKGDIPIGISSNSVDAWTSPQLLNLDASAGAPPDDFSVLGQNWGFPTYNWPVMACDGFAWWKARFRKMSEYFDAYRIDHVLGFFRIWQIPLDAIHGLLGFFNPALPMTPDEMLHLYDFHFSAGYHAVPYIADWMLTDIFGEFTDQVRAEYLQPLDDDPSRYSLRPEFSTQRRIADYFAAQPSDQRSERICNGLMELLDQVLFIADPYQPGHYHPRIAAQYTFAYRSLNDYERMTFNRLYDDFFYHRHNGFWYESAMSKLPAITDATDMLVCAEDLGMIPACVPDVMRRLRILSLEIQRMPKDSSVEFADPAHYPYLSVCTTSTHDMPGIRQWWETDRDATQRFFNQMLHHGGPAPYYAEPWICREIIEQHLQSPSMLCILPLQDWLSTDGALRRHDPRQEQINVPANPRHYWRYRMHLTLADLRKADSFNTELSAMISRSGRH